MRKIIWTLLLLLAACSNKKEEIPENKASEIYTNWYAGVGQFNGSLNFGNITANENKLLTVSVKNVGDSTLSGPAILSGSNFYLAYQNCASLLVGKSCVVKIGFNSNNKDNGPYSGSLQLGSQVAQISASVNIVSEPAEIEFLVNGTPVQNDTIDFGMLKYNQSVSLSLSIKIKHNPSPNSINNVSFSNNNSAFLINYDNCSNKVIKEGSACIVKLAINGSGKSGIITENLTYGSKTLSLKAQVKNLETVALEESDVKLIVNNQSFASGTVDLGTWNLNKNKIINLYLKNEGSESGVVEDILLAPELTTLYSNCEAGQILKAKGSCLMKILSVPSSKGTLSSLITLQGNEYQLQSIVREPGDKVYCSIENADQSFITWNGSTYSNCIVESCLITHHLMDNSCEPNVVSCELDNGVGTRTWADNQYGECLVSDCDDNYHSEAGACLSDTKSCDIVNGIGSQTWNGFAYTNCAVASCVGPYHKDGNLCISDTQNCEVDHGSGTKLWNGSSYNTCQVNNCITNYHIAGNQCVANSQSCNIQDGTGSQTWGTNDWNTCSVVGCNTNFHTENNLTCISNTRSCFINNGTGSQTWSAGVWGTCNLTGCGAGFAAYGNSCLVASNQWRVRHVSIQQGHTPRTANWEFSDPSGVLSYTTTGSQTMDNNPINNSSNQPWGFPNNCNDQGAILGLSTTNSYTLSIQFSSPKHLSQVRAYSVYSGGARVSNMAIEYFNGSTWVNVKSWNMSAPGGCGWIDTGSFNSSY